MLTLCLLWVFFVLHTHVHTLEEIRLRGIKRGGCMEQCTSMFWSMDGRMSTDFPSCYGVSHASPPGVSRRRHHDVLHTVPSHADTSYSLNINPPFHRDSSAIHYSVTVLCKFRAGVARSDRSRTRSARSRVLGCTSGTILSIISCVVIILGLI